MEQYKSIFRTKFQTILKSMKEEASNTKDAFHVATGENGRQIHFNRALESIERMKSLIEQLETLDMENELVAEEAKKRLAKIIERSLIFAKEEDLYDNQ